MKPFNVRGEKYAIVVLHVLKKDEFDRPLECRILYDEETIQIKGGEEFVTVAMPAHMTTPKTKGSA